MQLCLLSTVLVVAFLGFTYAAPNYFYHSESSSETIERRPLGCCHKNVLVTPGNTMCTKGGTPLKCVKKKGLLGFGLMWLVFDRSFDCDDYDPTEEEECAPTKCRYDGKSAKLGSVIEKTVSDNKYKVVLCLKDGGIKTMTGTCVDKATGKDDISCVDFGPPMPGTGVPPTGRPATEEPDSTGRPESTGRPGATGETGTTSEPDGTGEPGTTSEPDVTTGEPGTTSESDGTGEPGTTSEPDGTEEPGTTSEPDVTTGEPGTTNESEGTTGEPGTTGTPETTAKADKEPDMRVAFQEIDEDMESAPSEFEEDMNRTPQEFEQDMQRVPQEFQQEMNYMPLERVQEDPNAGEEFFEEAMNGMKDEPEYQDY